MCSQIGLPQEPVPRVRLELGVLTNWLARGTGSWASLGVLKFLKEPSPQVPQGTLPPRFLTAPFPQGSFKASQNLLLAFFIWKALQAFKALQTGKGMQASEALGFLHNFQNIAFGVLYLESLACL